MKQLFRSAKAYIISREQKISQVTILSDLERHWFLASGVSGMGATLSKV